MEGHHTVQYQGTPGPPPVMYQPPAQSQQVPPQAHYPDMIKQDPMIASVPQGYPQPIMSPPPPQPVPVYTMPGAPAPQGPMNTMGVNASGSHLVPWSSPIFDCLNPVEKAFMACCCPCIVFGKTRARMRDPSLASYDTVNSDCATWTALGLCGFSCIYQWMSRREIREKYAIKGDDAEDAVWTACCPVCALVQEEKEVIYRTTGVHPGAPAPGPVYVPQPQMQMAPQHQ